MPRNIYQEPWYPSSQGIYTGNPGILQVKEYIPGTLVSFKLRNIYQELWYSSNQGNSPGNLISFKSRNLHQETLISFKVRKNTRNSCILQINYNIPGTSSQGLYTRKPDILKVKKYSPVQFKKSFFLLWRKMIIFNYYFWEIK